MPDSVETIEQPEPETTPQAPSTPRDVLMLGWEFPPYVSGGVGVACYGLTREMSRAGHRILFLMPRPAKTGFTAAEPTTVEAPEAGEPTHDDLGPGLPEFDNVTFRGVGDRRIDAYATGISHSANAAAETPAGPAPKPPVRQPARHRPADKPEPIDPAKEAKRFAESARDVADREIAAGRKVDVVHAHDWLTFEAARRIADKLGVKFVAHVHSTEYDRVGELADPSILEAEANGLRSADAIVAVSSYTADVVAERYGLDRASITVIHNAADADPRFAQRRSDRISAHERIVLFVGRLTKQKNPHGFLRAAAKVLEQEPSARFVIAGAGPEADSLRRLAEELKIGERTLFAGHLRSDDVARLFASADLFVMPSRSEPFGLVGLEAMSHGVPTIISNQSGLSERVENVLTADFWDDDDLATKMVDVLHDDALAADLSDRGSLEVRQMRWQDA
ncbi:MAG: glycosyltransferase family 4 protein, partial [Planctomycetota bacterium]